MKKYMRTILSAVTAICFILPQLIYVSPKASGASSADLSAINLNCGELSPSFSPNVTDYTVNVSDIVSLLIQPVATDSDALITINGDKYQTGSYYCAELPLGSSTIDIAVSTQGNFTKYYTLTVFNTNSSTAAGLSGLAVDCGELNPLFDTNTLAYTVNIENSISSATVTATAIDASQTISVNGKTVDSGVGFNLPLSIGDNSAVVTVYNSDGSSKTYVITITRSSSDSSVGLSGLSVSSGTLSPVFSTNTLTYIVSVQNSVSSATITPTALSCAQTITVNGEKMNSGEDFILPLSAGENSVVITVSSSGSSSKTYVLTVTRESTSACLSSLVMSAGSLSPSFSSTIYFYYASVENDVTRLYFSATASNPAATVKVNGSSSGYASLNVGYNTITVTVTAYSTIKTYTITVFRKFETNITITSPNSSGAYCAAVPDYATLLSDSDALTFSLGGDTIVVPISTIKTYKSASGLAISRSEISQSSIKKASLAADSKRIIAGGADIRLSGGSASDCCYINAAATIKLKSGVKAILKGGVPEIYYFNSDSNTLVKIDADFDMSAGTVTFKAALSGEYVFAVSLTDYNVNYTVVTDSSYSNSGSLRTFGVKIIRESDSIRLSVPRLLVVTTLSTGSQTTSMIGLTGDSCDMTVSVSGKAVRSTVYLISGNFDGKDIPKSYSLIQFVNA